MSQGVVVMEGENKADMSDNSEPVGVARESHSEEVDVVEEYATVEASEAEVDKEESLVLKGENSLGLEEVVTDAREGSADSGDEQLLCVKDIVAVETREMLAEATRVDSTLANCQNPGCGGLGVIRGRQRSGCKATPILVVHSHHLSSRTVRQDLSSFLTAHLDE